METQSPALARPCDPTYLSVHGSTKSCWTRGSVSSLSL